MTIGVERSGFDRQFADGVQHVVWPHRRSHFRAIKNGEDAVGNPAESETVCSLRTRSPEWFEREPSRGEAAITSGFLEIVSVFGLTAPIEEVHSIWKIKMMSRWLATSL